MIHAPSLNRSLKTTEDRPESARVLPFRPGCLANPDGRTRIVPRRIDAFLGERVSASRQSGNLTHECGVSHDATSRCAAVGMGWLRGARKRCFSCGLRAPARSQSERRNRLSGEVVGCPPGWVPLLTVGAVSRTNQAGISGRPRKTRRLTRQAGEDRVCSR